MIDIYDDIGTVPYHDVRVCDWHKEMPSIAILGGCTCSVTTGRRPASPNERRANINRKIKEIDDQICGLQLARQVLKGRLCRMGGGDLTHQEQLAWIDGLAVRDTLKQRAKTVYRQILEAAGDKIPVPPAGAILEDIPIDEQVVFFSWDRGVHHFEVEIFPTVPTDWFYRKRDGDETDLDSRRLLEIQVGEPLPPAVVDILKLFCEGE
jgi:hypothetical protein